MKKTILPIGALIVCATISISVFTTACNKNDSLKDQQDPEISSDERAANTEFTVATANGFAAGTTGGSGTSITVSGNINLGSSQINVKSNKTIIGANSSSGIIGCLRLSGVSNVIIQNLNITNPSGAGTGDGIEVSGSTRVFVTKCTFTDCSDG